MLLFEMVKVLFCIFVMVSLLLWFFVFNVLIFFLIWVKDFWLVLCMIGIIRLFGVLIVMFIWMKCL